MRRIDPATFEVVKNSLFSAAEEMKVVLAKTAYSPLLKIAGDYSCGIFDAWGEMVAQGPDLPIHLGSMPVSVKAVLKAWDTFQPGDVFIHNDPYFGGSHLPDVNVITPIFHDDGTLLGFACVRAHWPDVGGVSPGSYGATMEIYGEGLRLPPVRLFIGGVLNKEMDEVIFANVRTPEERRGDLRAQVAANHRAALRVQALARKYGKEQLLEIMQEVMDYSERMMRAQLRHLPDGVGTFEDFCDGDGILDNGEEDEPIQVKLTVTKRGDQMMVDFTGSDAQVQGPMNAPLAVTASGVYTAVKMVADPRNLIPPNSGCWRPIQVHAPEGTVVNVLPPAPVVYANHEMTHRICDMLFGALAQLVPENVMACSQGTSAIFILGGVDHRTGRRYVSYETLGGGLGARPMKDGINSIKAGISNTMNAPVEVLEMSFPVRVDRYEILDGTGGAGKYRGGCGAQRVWRILGSSAQATVCCERTKSPPFGLLGGKPGAPGRITLVIPDGTSKILNSKGPAFTVPRDGEVWYRAPGSGGYGNPQQRDPERLREDVVNGYVTQESAVRDYGVHDQALLTCPYCVLSEGDSS